MATKAGHKKSARHHAKASAKRVQKGRRGGWAVRDATGRISVHLSSESSNTVLDDALTRYARAMRRLADR
jgi:hypothetical protein